MIVTIPFKSNKTGLAALLVNLQPQLTADDIVYIVDNSTDKDGLKLAEMYGGSRSLILVEVGNFNIYQSWNIGIQSMIENKQEGILILNDDVLLSYTCISNLKKAHKLTHHLCLVTKTPTRFWSSNKLDPNFNWFNSPTKLNNIIDTDWMPGFAFYLKRECVEKLGLFDEHFKVWFGDTDYEDRLNLNKKIGLLSNEYIYHYGNKSFNYKDSGTQALIAKDRILYDKKASKSFG